MTDDRDLPPLDPLLADLFSAERRRPAPEGEQKLRVRHALAASIPGGFGLPDAPLDAGGGPGGAPDAAPDIGSGLPLDPGVATAGGAAGAAKVATGGAAVAGGAAASGAAIGSGKIAALAVATVVAGGVGYGGVKAVQELRPEPAPHGIVEPAPARPASPLRELADDPPAGGALGEVPLAEPADLPKAEAPVRPKPERPMIVKPKPAPVVVAPVVEQPPVVEPTREPVRTPEERASQLREERALLENGRTALAGGDGAAALSRVETHAERFPRGALAEEREALRVQALVKLGRPDDARAALSKFEATWPQSLFLPALRAAAR